LPKYLKSSKIENVFFLESVEDDRCFSSLKFVKSNFQNMIGPHLPMVVKKFRQQFFTLDAFPYKDAIKSYLRVKKNIMVNFDV
jgi:hypothetical protein